MHDKEEERFRGEVGFKHREEISPLTRFAANLSWLSDRDYYRDFSDQNGIYNQQLAVSTAYLTTTGNDYAMSADLLLTQNLDSSNSTTLQRLPRLAFSSFRTPLLNSPLSFTLDARATHFYRDEGEQGERLEVAPVLSWQLGLGDMLNVTTWAGYRQRFYRADGNSDTDGAQGDGIPMAGVTASTTLSRVYDVDGAMGRRIQHVMVPEVSYLWVEANDQERLPFFDYDDRVLRQNMVKYSLSNYLTVREEQADGTPQYRDLLSLVISQAYSFSGERRDLLTLVDEGNPFTDVKVETKYQPNRDVSLVLDGQYDPYAGKISTFVVSGEMMDRRGDKAAVGYRFARDEVDYFEGRLTLALLRPFTLSYLSRYSLDGHHFLEQYYTLEYRKQCWSVLLTYRHRPDNDELQVGFTLYGIGTPGVVKIL
jgi:LPS-assembly protein